MLNLHVIVGSVRKGRAGIALAHWFEGVARADDRFRTRLIDLAEVHLPMDDEPNHPRLHDYVQAHTKLWSETIDEADAFVLVTPEYNYSVPASLKNALDHLGREWAGKPVGYFSYGGVSGGLRCVQQLRLITGALGMVSINEGVVAPFFTRQVEGEVFTPSELQETAARQMLDALADWGTMLQARRS